jgi:hypothetical protein
VQANEPSESATPAPPVRTLGIDRLVPRPIPRDGGTMLAAAALLGVLSFFSHVEGFRFGPGPMPAWIPFALDAAIAGIAGAVLVLGARWFADDVPETSPDYVVVAKPVWDGIQREVLAARVGKVAPAFAETPIRPPGTPPSSNAAVPLTNPWDEGPPLTAEELAALERELPPVGPSPVPPPAARMPAPPPATPARVPAGTPGTAPNPAPALRSTPPTSPTETPALSAAELEEITRLGAILGIVQRRDETDVDYSRRLTRELESMSKSAPEMPPAPTPNEARAKGAPPEPTGSPDIDELMSWLDKMKEEQAAGSLVPAPKKEWGKADGSDADPKSE